MKTLNELLKELNNDQQVICKMKSIDQREFKSARE